RIISGSAKGKHLESPKNAARPMREMVRGALFNILNRYEGVSFLDLFAGTGAVGIEALSRGFESSLFVELTGQNCRIIDKNLEITGFSSQSKVVRANVFVFLNSVLKSGNSFDVVFSGTPYMDEILDKLFERINDLIEIVSENGVLVIQAPSKYSLPAIPIEFEKRVFGGDALYFYYK
ncbi:MAG: hypothetical protein EOM23_10280, partial [Candidatus Moranbacteria bacterium]|nr:hypothetical protein [Candidatus Moranbacteria bacterium]